MNNPIDSMTDEQFNAMIERIEIEKKRAVDAFRHTLYDKIKSYYLEAEDCHELPMSKDLGLGYRNMVEDLLQILKRNNIHWD